MWKCQGAVVTPELAAAVGISGHDRGGRHAARLSRRSGEGFMRATVSGGDLSADVVGGWSRLALANDSKKRWGVRDVIEKNKKNKMRKE